MIARSLCGLGFGWLALVLLGGIAAQSQVQAQTQAQTPAAPGFVVKYRLASWKTSHLHDTAKAKQMHDVLKKNLGCEVELHDHDGHLDLRYRCVSWRSITLASDAQAHQWVDWLKGRGFETHHTD